MAAFFYPSVGESIYKKEKKIRHSASSVYIIAYFVSLVKRKKLLHKEKAFFMLNKCKPFVNKCEKKIMFCFLVLWLMSILHNNIRIGNTIWRLFQERNKTMKENEKRTKVTEFTEEICGYNVCPKCGGSAYTVTTADGMYYVGCVHCGLRHGVSISTMEEQSDDYREATRLEWNKYCLQSEYSEEALAVLGGEFVYIVSDPGDNYIVFASHDVKEVKEFFETVAKGTACEMYLLHNGYPEYLGSSFLLWLFKES